MIMKSQADYFYFKELMRSSFHVHYRLFSIVPHLNTDLVVVLIICCVCSSLLCLPLLYALCSGLVICGALFDVAYTTFVYYYVVDNATITRLSLQFVMAVYVM